MKVKEVEEEEEEEEEDDDDDDEEEEEIEQGETDDAFTKPAGPKIPYN